MINVDDISFEYLKRMEEQISNDIQNLNSMEFVSYSLDDFENMTVEEIINVLNKNEMSNVVGVANNIYNFFKMEKRKFSNVDFFANSRNEIRGIINEIIEDFNAKILEKKQASEKSISKLQKKLDFVKALVNIYDNNSVSEINLEEIQSIILGSDFSDEDKFKLSVSIVNKLIKQQTEAIILEVNDFSRQKESIITESIVSVELPSVEFEEVEEDERLENSVIRDFFNKYRDIFIDNKIENTEELIDYYGDDTSFGEVLDCDIVDKTEFFIFLISMLDKIKKSDNELNTEKYIMYLEKMDYKFNYWNKEFYEKKIEEVNSIISSLLNNISQCYNTENTNYDLLSEIQEQIVANDKIIKENILSSAGFEKVISDLKLLKEKIKKLKRENNVIVRQSEIDTKNSVSVKGFVFFDYFNGDKKVPYVLSDLNYNSGNNLIDRVLNGKERKDALNDFNDLIFDLIKLGKSRYIDSSNPNVGDNASRIVNRIYYDNDNTKFTGMLRIRARRNSDLRFCEQTITFIKGTEAFNQVEEILIKYLPNLKIDIENGEEFQVYVNYASAMKRTDEGLYDVAISRRDTKKSDLVKTFISNFKGKTKLTDKECRLFEEMVQLSLSTFDELRQQNDKFKFEIVDQLVGGIKHNEK